MKKIFTMAVMILLLSSVCGTAFAEKGAGKELVQKAVKAKRATTLFDLAHHEIFSPVKDGPLNYSEFYKLVKEKGGEPGINDKPVTAESLKGIKTYVIAGPIKPFTAQEIAALESFVKNGGNLLVLLHISFPVAELTSSFGIVVSNFTIGETTGLIENKSQDFLVTKFGQHATTAGVEKMAVFGTWGLMANEPAKVVASTSAKAWADVNRNRTFDKDEPTQEFGIVAVRNFGKGKVAVVADDAPFANQFIGGVDNRRLAENILKWFKQ